MNLRCPNCNQALNSQSFKCVNGHQMRFKDDILILLEDSFKETLQNYTTTFAKLRNNDNKRLTDAKIYKQLPNAPKLKWQYPWRVRRYDLAVIANLLKKRKQQHILEVGAWNGWLSNRLTEWGHIITAIDFFIDEYDGLGAKKFYDNTWQTIQMNVYDLSVLDDLYDVIIFNRCIQFSTNPPAYVASAIKKLAPNGLLIITGLGIYYNPATKIKDVASFRKHLAEYGLDFLSPTKGYLDSTDMAHLLKQGIKLQPYPQLWAKLINLKATLNKQEPFYCYGYFQNPKP